MADSESTSVRFSFRKKPLPALSDLLSEARRIYEYSEAHRGLIWKNHKNPKRPWPPLGSAVGGNDGHGYRMCLLLGHKFKVHQLVWLLFHGELPRLSIDHLDGDRMNNKIENLRLASDHQNSMNLASSRRSFAGVKNQSRSRPELKRPFAAVVHHNGKKHYFGFFSTPEEARSAYIEGKRLLCGDFSPV